MTFNSAVSGLREGMAVKRPSMRGYVFRDTSMLGEEDAGSGKCALVFVEADGKRTSFPIFGLPPVEMDGAKGEVRMSVNACFIEGMLADDWAEAPIESYETARSGSGGRW